MKRRVSLLLIGLLFVVQILQGFGFAGIASAEETAATIEQSATAEQANTAGSIDVAPEDTGIAPNTQGQEDSELSVPEETGTEEGATGNPASDELGEEDADALPDEDVANEEKNTDSETQAEEAAEERPAQAIEKNLIDSVSLTIMNGQGEFIAYDPDTLYEQNAVIDLAYTWSIPDDHEYQAGDWYEFELPKEFILERDLQGELKFGSDSVGTFEMSKSDRKIKMTFNGFIKDYNNIKGELFARTTFNLQEFSSGKETAVVFPVNENLPPFTFKIKSAVKESIEKKGEVDKKFAGRVITWTVDFNKTQENVANAVLNDPIQTGLELDKSSVEIYKLNVGLDGSVSQGEQVSSMIPEDGSDLVLKFGTIDSAYRVVYKTNITENVEGEQSYTNTATLDGDGPAEPPTATATVSTSFGKLLDKTYVDNSYNSAKQSATWKIYYNYGLNTIAEADAVLKDTFDGQQKLVDGANGITVYRIDAPAKNGDESGKIKVDLNDAYTVDENSDGFELRFKGDVTSAYMIEYATQAINPVYDNNKEGKFVNTVESGGKTASDEVGIGQVYGIKNYVDKSANYVDKTIGWKIEINKNDPKRTMENVKIQDTFTNRGLELVENSFVIEGPDGELKEGDDYTFALRNDVQGNPEGFDIVFTGDHAKTSYSYTLTYLTKFDTDRLSSGKTKFLNDAVVTWTDESGSHTVKTGDDFEPNAKALNNGYKSGSYNAINKKISWTIGVNYNLKEVGSASIVDTLTHGQKPDPSSIRVHEMRIDAKDSSGNKIAAGDLVENTEYTVRYVPAVDYDPATDTVSGTLTVTFKNAIPAGKGYILTFDTSLENLVTTASIPNTAVLNSGTNPVSKQLKASASVATGGEFVKKEGKQNAEDEDVIDWTIWINRGQSTVDKAVLEDRPSSNQLFMRDLDAFKLYATNVSEKGVVTKDDSRILERGKDYTIEFKTDQNGAETFTLSFLRTITTAYVLEYQTLTTAQNGVEVFNNAVFSGENARKISGTNEGKVKVVRSVGGGTGSGENYRLTVLKVQEGSESTVLAGAEFKLERVRKGKISLIGIQTTDSEGKIEFKNLLLGDYLLTETKAPAGYVLDDEPLPLTIKSVGDGGEANSLQTVTNQKTPAPPVTPPGPPVNPEPPVTPPGPPITPETPETPPGPPIETPETPVDPPVTPPVDPAPETPTETPTPKPPGLYFPQLPLPTPLIVLPEDGTPSGGLEVDPDPVTPTPETPIVPEAPVEVPSAVQPVPQPVPDEDLNLLDETPRGGLDIDPDPAVPDVPTQSPDSSVPSGSPEFTNGLLPQTGETGAFPMRALGFAMILVGAIGFTLIRKKKLNEQK